MFEYIKGILTQLTPTTAVVEVAGVGWFVNITLHTSTELSSLGEGSEVKLFLHEYVAQEQAPVLYGFYTEKEREMFRLLISVSGIGASTARIMLSTYSAAQLSGYINAGNARAIQKTKGIGQRTAERLLVELKGKVGSFEESGPAAEISSVEEEAVTALVVLGFPKASAEKTVHKVYSENKSVSVEDLIRKSLSQL